MGKLQAVMGFGEGREVVGGNGTCEREVEGGNGICRR